MAPIDCLQSNVEEELNISKILNQIFRKIKDNIFNVAYEQKAEEFAWFHLLPYGINGINEKRPVKITSLDYYQYKVMGKDIRFQRDDYLFYKLSMFKYNRIKLIITAFARNI